MTEQEKINSEVQTKFVLQDAKIDLLTQEMRDFKEEMREFKNEMRDFKAEMRESRARQDEDMRELRTALNNNVRNMFITLIIGVGAMVVAVMMK